jgi:hypothetical protein
MNPLFQMLTKKVFNGGGFAWKWYADPVTKTKRNSVDYTPQEKPALGVKKMV